MKRPKVNFTLKERKKLSKAGINFRHLDKYKLGDISHALCAKNEREAEIRKILDNNNMNWGAPIKKVRGHNSHALTFTSSLLGLSHGSDILRSFSALQNVVPTSFQILSKTLAGYQTSMKSFEATYKPLTNIVGIANSTVLAHSMMANTALTGISAPTNLATAITPLIGISKLTNSAAITGAPKIWAEQFNHAGAVSMIYNSGISFANVVNNPTTAFNIARSVTDPLGLASSLARNAFSAAPVAGSLLELSGYKNLGIANIAAESFRTSLFENAHTNIATTFMSAMTVTQLAESGLSQFDWSSLGRRLEATKAYTVPAQLDFLAFSEGYRDVLQSVSKRPNWIYEAPTVAELPTLEYYASTAILRVVTEDNVVEEVIEKTEELNEATRDVLVEYLPRLDADLPIMWHGAIQSLKSKNPDKIRHFITSLRELFTHVLHLMAPDNDFEAWDSNRLHYVNGRPTRKGRFLYICRDMAGSDEAFAKFMQNDIDSVLSLIGLFQGGTHKIKSDFSPKELELIRIRAEASLRTFLTIEFEINRS
jgi:hypothetical protein